MKLCGSLVSQGATYLTRWSFVALCSQSAIYLTENQVYHARTKLICLACKSQAHLFEVK